MRYTRCISITLTAAFLAALIFTAATAAHAKKARASTSQTGFNSSCLFSHQSEDDPIVEPAPGMGHTHNFFANKSATQASDGASLLANPSHTCTREAQASSYWIPEVRWGDQVISPTRTGVYYQSADGLDHRLTRDTPFGLEAIAKGQGAPGRLEFYCGVKNQGKGGPSAPNRCLNHEAGLGISISFPECLNPNGPKDQTGWDLVDAKKRPDGTRKCPDHHPRQIPTLILHVDYPTLPDQTGPLTVAGGSHGAWLEDTSMHADYINAEDYGEFVRDCISGRQAGSNRPAKCNK